MTTSATPRIGWHAAVIPDDHELANTLTNAWRFGKFTVSRPAILLPLVWAGAATSFAYITRSWTAGIHVVIGLYGGVALHETAHALAAHHRGMNVRQYGIRLRGGFVEWNPPTGTMHRPSDIAVIAAAGPLVNLTLAAIWTTTAIIIGTGNALTPGTRLLIGLETISFLGNSVPIKPADGWHVWRAWRTARSRHPIDTAQVTEPPDGCSRA